MVQGFEVYCVRMFNLLFLELQFVLDYFVGCIYFGFVVALLVSI